MRIYPLVQFLVDASGSTDGLTLRKYFPNRGPIASSEKKEIICQDLQNLQD